MIRRGFATSVLAAAAPAKVARPARGWMAYFADPRTAVLFFLGSALVIGGGRRVLMGMRARRSVEALAGENPSPVDVEAAAEHGRSGLTELFRLLGTAEKPEVRDAAGRALARLWAKDELIAEEEKALVRRGYVVTFRARRKYPRALAVPIPINVAYGVPFLLPSGPGVTSMNLEWSHRILGAERAGLEKFTPWEPGPGLASFAIDPRDFAGVGPHRLAIHARVRLVGLTEAWELDLPHIPFSVEFDPILAVDALLTLPDHSRGQAIEQAITLDKADATTTPTEPDLFDPILDNDAMLNPSAKLAKATTEPTYLDLNADLVLRDPPSLVVVTPLPADLAHRMEVEIEGVDGRFAAGSVVVNDGSSGVRRFPFASIVGLPDDAISRPGEIRIRAILTADPDLGWTDPDVRSIWPGTITTGWTAVRVIRK